MLRSALAARSAVLLMHAVFLVPSVVAVPCLRPVSASERAGSCIPGPQSNRNAKRNQVGVQYSMDVASVRLVMSSEFVATSHSLAMPGDDTGDDTQCQGVGPDVDVRCMLQPEW